MEIDDPTSSHLKWVMKLLINQYAQNNNELSIHKDLSSLNIVLLALTIISRALLTLTTQAESRGSVWNGERKYGEKMQFVELEKEPPAGLAEEVLLTRVGSPLVVTRACSPAELIIKALERIARP